MAAALSRPQHSPSGDGASSHHAWLADDASPDAFAFIMATGIVAHDASLLDARMLASVLLSIATVAYVILLAVTLARAVHAPGHVLADLASQQRGPGFLALVAATGVLGVDIAPLSLQVSTALWLLEVVLWVGITYVFFAAVAAHEHKPRPPQGLTGRWLLAVVATQSVALLGAMMSSRFGGGEPLLLFVSLSVFLSACVLYLALIPPILHRLEFLSLAPRAFTPEYWINMGAMAITALTGAVLISLAGRWFLLEQVLPFLFGLTLLFWAGATWWIPLLVLLEVWRHVLRHVRLTYATEYWSMAFPVGMYAACTFALSGLVDLELLAVLARWLTYVAISLWLIVFAGLLRHLVSKLIGAASSRTATHHRRGRAHHVI